jgi:hypothetical protein
MSGRIQSFEEFWPFYLGEHAKRATRILHVTGSTAALGFVALAATLRKPAWLGAALGVGYAFAWVAHLAVEHNRPATFRYPLWSFAADWKMWALTLSGRLDRELERVGAGRGVSEPAQSAYR